MTGIEVILAGSIGGGVAAAGTNQIISNMLSSDGSHRSWYEFGWLYNIFQFPDEYTDLIDMMLAKDPRAIVRNWIVKSSSVRIPAQGEHYYYWSGCKETWLYWHYVTFQKKLSPQNTYFYVCHATKTQIDTFAEAIQKIFKTEAGKVRTISIDTSRQSGPFPLFIDKIYKIDAAGLPVEKPHQQVAVDHIIASWSADVNRNTKVVVSGLRGSGKSYLARLLKLRIEANPAFSECLVRLYDDFNPSVPGCSIKLLVLQNAKIYTPVILIIDEIDIYYDLAATGNRADKHTLTVHTKDKNTLNIMLDSIGDTQNIITIFTTEKSPDDLYTNAEWHSFMRKGRVDYFLNYVQTSSFPANFRCDKVEHSDIQGYTDDG